MAFSNAPQYSTYQQKMVPFYAEPLLREGTTPRDQRYYNCFPEAYKTAHSDQKNFFLRRRFGLTTITTFDSGPVRGALTYEGYMYWVADNIFYAYDGTNPPINRGTLSTSTGTVVMQPYEYDGNSLQYILVSDGINLYNYDISAQTFGPSPAAYPTPHSPYFEVMDGYILMVKTGTSDMYNSQLSDWTLPWDFLSAEMYPDKLIGLRRFNNYIMAVGSETMEMFYNAAIEDGSPFARNDSVIATIGCRAMGTAIQTDRKFMWLGATQDGDISVWTMDEFKPTEIATPAVKMAINSDPLLPLATGYSCRVQGHQFYVIRLSTVTWVFDVNEKIWHQWDFNNGLNWPIEHGGEVIPGRFYGLNDTGRVLWFNPTGTVDFSDLDGFPIQARWQMEPITFETMNRKFLNRLTIVGDTSIPAAQIYVSYSDDDFATWSPYRLIDMSKPRPALVNLGYFRRRTFRFLTNNETPWRLEGMELTYNSGVN